MKEKAIYFCFLASVVTGAYFAYTTDSKTDQSPVVKNESMAISPAQAKPWVVKKLANEESLATVQFIDQARGWVVSRKGNIYVTSDGGETWQLKRVDMPLDSEVSASFFVDSLTGWVSILRLSPDVLLPNKERAWLMKTEDGGNSWVEQYSQKAVQLTRLYFVSPQEGWAVGSRTIKRDTLQTDGFVLHSVDAGKHWTVVSDSLPKGEGGLEDAYYDKAVGLSVLNSDGRVFLTSDGGARWSTIAAVPDEPMQTFFGRFGDLADKRMWFVGGSASYEGTWGVLAFKDPDSNTWLKLKTHAYLYDVMFLSADKVIACGFTSGKRGVILRSSDGGRSWVTDMPPNASAAFTALARAGDHVWVIGERGYIAMLKDF